MNSGVDLGSDFCPSFQIYHRPHDVFGNGYHGVGLYSRHVTTVLTCLLVFCRNLGPSTPNSNLFSSKLYVKQTNVAYLVNLFQLSPFIVSSARCHFKTTRV